MHVAVDRTAYIELRDRQVNEDEVPVYFSSQEASSDESRNSSVLDEENSHGFLNGRGGVSGAEN